MTRQYLQSDYEKELVMDSDYLQQSFLPATTQPCRKAVGTQGTKANMTGKVAEDTIYCMLKEWGYSVDRQRYVGESIYGTRLYVDFYIETMPRFKDGLIIESKWQSTGGSVDEKFPYLVANIRDGRYPCPVIIVLDGGGYKPGAEQWLRRQADGQKLVAVYSFQEAIQWLMNINL